MPLIQSLVSQIPTPVGIAGTLLATAGAGLAVYLHNHPSQKHRLSILYKKHILRDIIPVSVNFHFTRKCNAECVFCFHTDTSSHVESTENIEAALRLLKKEGMQKINFAGGEPFLYQKQLGEMCKFAKQDVGRWLEKYGPYVDILAISCDSFSRDTNRNIGRAERATGEPFDNVKQLFRIRDWCAELGIKFKLNTVVCSLNWDEDMRETVTELAPFRWKVFQVLIVYGENESDERKRDARKLAVTDEQFGVFCKRHGHVVGFTPEANAVMRSSYLILDEYLKFLDKGEGEGEGKNSEKILEVGVQRALKQIKWDQESFVARGGVYDWSKDDAKKSCGDLLEGIDRKKLEF